MEQDIGDRKLLESIRDSNPGTFNKTNISPRFLIRSIN